MVMLMLRDTIEAVLNISRRTTEAIEGVKGKGDDD